MRPKSLLNNALFVVLAIFSSLTTYAATPISQVYEEEFRIDPMTALMTVAKSPSFPKKLPGEPAEMKFLVDARDGQLDTTSYTEAALITAGIHDAQTRQYYTFQLEQLATQAKEATAKAKTPELKGMQLAKFLYKGQMSPGYVSHQYDFKKLLNTGKYNCVSSALLYSLIGERLGLNVEYVEIPGHIFCRMGDIDIEPTSGKVYLTSMRAERVKEKRDADDDLPGSAFADKLFIEGNKLCVLSEIYADDGNAAVKKDLYQDALIKFLKAAILDHEHHGNAKQIHRTFRQWFKFAKDHKRIQEAAAIANLYGQLVRDTSRADRMFEELRSQQTTRASQSNRRQPRR